MIEFIAIIKKYTTKDGRIFYGAKTNKKYLSENIKKENHFAINNSEDLKEGTTYSVRPVGSQIPQKEGIYLVTSENRETWLDNRAEFLSKNIVRTRGNFKYIKPLKNFENTEINKMPF